MGKQEAADVAGMAIAGIGAFILLCVLLDVVIEAVKYFELAAMYDAAPYPVRASAWLAASATVVVIGLLVIRRYGGLFDG